MTQATTSLRSSPAASLPTGVASRRAVQFVLATFAATWIPMLVLIMVGADVSTGPAQAVFGVVACGPSLVAGLFYVRFRSERRPIRRPRGRMIAAGLLIGAAIPVLPSLVLQAGHLSTIAASSAQAVAGVGGVAGFVGLTLITGPLAEEFGWRGYLQPRVRRRFGVFGTWLVIGPIWAL